MPTLAIYIKKLKIVQPYDPQIFSPRYISEEDKNTNLKGHMNLMLIAVLFTIGKTREQLVFNSRWMNKEDVRYIYMCVCVSLSISISVSIWGFPCGAKGKEPAYQCRRCKRCGFNPWVQKSPWRRAWLPAPVFWSIPWTEEPGALQSMALQRVGHNWSDWTELNWSDLRAVST